MTSFINHYFINIIILVYLTYPSPKAENPIANKTIPLMNTTFVLSLLLCGCEVDVGNKVDIITKRNSI